MSVKFAADTSGLSGGLGNAASMLSGFAQTAGSAFGPVGVALAGIATVAIGVGAASTKMASDYQQSMNMVQALTGSNTAQMDSYSNSLKALAVNAGVAPTELSKGLYQVLSAGYSGAAAMNVLTLATEDSKIGMTSAAVTGNALTTVLKAFSVPIKDAARVNGEMLETVTLGKMTMEQYAGAIGKASSTSMQFHVSMENMNASIATLTANGIPSASQAVTDYNQSLSVMYGNIGTVSKSLNKNGIAFDEAKFNTMSYTDKIQYMNKELVIAADKHVHITGVTKQAAAAIQIISQHSGEYAKNLGLLSDKQSMAEKTQQAWAITQGGFNQTMDRLKASLDVVMIDIGSKLLPILTSMGNAVVPIISGFGNLISNSGSLGNAVGGLGISFAPVQQAFQMVEKSIKGFNFGPLIANFSLLGGTIKSDVKPAFAEISSIIGGAFQSHMKTAEGIVASLSKWFNASLMPAVHQAMPGFQSLASVMIGTVIPGMVKLWAIGQKVVDEVMPPLISIFEAAAPVMVKLGGIISTGLAASLKFLMPYILQGAAALGQFAGEIATRVAPIAINFFHNLNTAINVFMAVWKAVWPYLAPILKGVWDEIVGVIKVAWAIVSGIVKIGLDLLSGNWSGAWDDLKNMLSGVWDGIKQIIGGGIEIITGDIKAFVAGIVGFFQWLWDTLTGHSIIPDMVNSIISWFGNLVSGAIGWIQSMVTIIKERITVFTFAVIVTVQSWVNTIIKFFGNLGTQAASKISDMISTITGLLNKFVGGAANFGATLIKNFASGITGAIGNVTSAIGNVVGAIGNFLPHSPAKQGELSHLNEYGPSFVKGLSEGITKSKPMLEMAVQATIAPMAKAGSYPASTSAYPSTRSYSSASHAPVIHNHNHFTVTIDGHEMAGVMVHPLMTEVVHQVRAQKSGGKAA